MKVLLPERKQLLGRLPLIRAIAEHLSRRWPEWVLLVLSLIKITSMGTGLVLGEPDEFTHAQVARSFEQSWVPMDRGNVWFFELPLYPLLGYLASFVVGNYYLSLRVVSALAALAATLGVYWLSARLFDDGGDPRGARLRSSPPFSPMARVSYRGFAIALIYTLSPLVFFYARVGMLDSTLVAFSFLFILCLELAIRKNSVGLGALSGLFLSIALLTKYSALIYVGVLGLVLIVRSLWLTLKNVDGRRKWSIRHLLELEYVELDTVTFLGLLIISSLAIPIAFAYFRYDSWQFKYHLFTNLGFVNDELRRAGSVLTVFCFLGNWVWWLSVPLSVLFLLGFVPTVRTIKKYPVFFTSFVVTVLVLIRQRPFYPRYFLMMIPFVAVIASQGLELMGEAIKNLSQRIWKKDLLGSSLVDWSLLGILVVLLIPPSITSWRSSRHSLIEDTSFFIRKISVEPNPWVFTNYWPNFFGEYIPTSKATWLSTSHHETRAYLPKETRSALEILQQEGGFVILEDLYAYSPMLISPSARTLAWEEIQYTYEPLVYIEDHSPHFPHFRVSSNKTAIYKIDPGTGREFWD